MTYNTYTYKRLRREGYGAKYALELARIDDALDGQELSLFGSDRVGIVDWDWDETDWGDIQPTEDERERTRSIWVSLTVHPMSYGDPDTTVELASAGIGGIDFAVDYKEAEGYTERCDAILYALDACLVPECQWTLDKLAADAAKEAAEASYWAERDVMTCQ